MSTFLRTVVLITILNIAHFNAQTPAVNCDTETDAPVVDAGSDITDISDGGKCLKELNLLSSATDDCDFTLICAPDTNDITYMYPVGITTVTCTATDQADNVGEDTKVITILDNEAPNATCQNINVELNANGNAQIEAEDIENGSTDNCGIDSLLIDVDTFTCDNVNIVNRVTLTVNDIHGNDALCNSTVTVTDSIDPVAICKDTTIQLDENGDGGITADDIDNGSNDACGIESMSIDKLSFICGDLGRNTVTLTVTDVNENENTCQSIVTVEPSIACTNDPTKDPTNGPTKNPTTHSPTKSPTIDSNSSENQSWGGSKSSSDEEEDFTALFEPNKKDYLHVNVDKKDVYINANDNTVLGIFVLFCCIVMAINLCYLCGKCINKHEELNFDSLKEITISK